jgi:osmotically-inducible protein OsmY
MWQSIMRRRECLLLGLLLLSGCQNKDADQLARLGTKLGQKVEAVFVGNSGRVAQNWPALPIHLGEVALDARVSARLRWDKQLSGATIKVSADGGTVELQGKGLTLEQRRRAVELAESTAGVEKVTDKLETSE